MWLTTKEASTLGAEEVAASLRVDHRTGLSWREAELRRKLTGHNEFLIKETDPTWKKYLEQVRDDLLAFFKIPLTYSAIFPSGAAEAEKNKSTID